MFPKYIRHKAYFVNLVSVRSKKILSMVQQVSENLDSALVSVDTISGPHVTICLDSLFKVFILIFQIKVEKKI